MLGEKSQEIPNLVRGYKMILPSLLLNFMMMKLINFASVEQHGRIHKQKHFYI
jgi:hypothetical protein